MKKELWFILGGLFLIVIAGGVSFLFLFTYSVTGKITDVTTKQPVKGIGATVSGITQQTDEEGNYKISGIKIFQKKNLRITVPAQYNKPADIAVDYRSRSIKKDVAIEPTLTEMVNRIWTATKNSQYDYLWDFMYPDDQAYWGGKDTYKDLMTKVGKIQSAYNQTLKSATIGDNIRQVTDWKSPITGKQYDNAMEVPENVVMVNNGQEQPQTTLEYYKSINGFYHYFTNTNKDDTQKTIDAYNSLHS